MYIGFYRDYGKTWKLLYRIIFILVHIGITDNKMETTVWGLGFGLCPTLLRACRTRPESNRRVWSKAMILLHNSAK